MAQLVAVPLVFLCLYALLTVFVGTQLAVLLAQGHKKRSFKSVFNFLCVLWTACRAVFWLLQVLNPEGSVLYFIVFWVPQALQFTVFVLLVVFFIKITNKSTWRSKVKQPVTRAAVGVCAGFTLSETLLAIIVGSADSYDPQPWIHVENIVCALMFMVLAALYLYFATKLHSLASRDFRRMFLFEPRVVTTVIVFLAIVFVSRAIFDGLVAFKVRLAIVSLSLEGWDASSFVLAMYALWELLPLVALLATIATGRKGVLRQIGTPSLGVPMMGGMDRLAAPDSDAASFASWESDRFDAEAALPSAAMPPDPSVIRQASVGSTHLHPTLGHHQPEVEIAELPRGQSALGHDGAWQLDRESSMPFEQFTYSHPALLHVAGVPRSGTQSMAATPRAGGGPVGAHDTMGMDQGSTWDTPFADAIGAQWATQQHALLSSGFSPEQGPHSLAASSFMGSTVHAGQAALHPGRPSSVISSHATSESKSASAMRR